MVLQFLKSDRGNDLLVHQGFTFYKNRSKNTKTYWKCTKYDSNQCRATCVTENEECTTGFSDHNHVADPAKQGVRAFLQNIKEKAVNEVQTPAQIIASACQNVPRAVASQLPSTSLLTMTIQNTRKKANQAPPHPKSRIELMIPQNYQSTNTGEKFLLYDSGIEEERILIFSTEGNLKMLLECQAWFADGTFKSCPTLFFQIYTIHGTKDGTVLPLVYCLLPNKKETTYTRMLTVLRDSLENLADGPIAPREIMSDFEHAFLNSVSRVFPQFSRNCCYFHFSQCVWKKIQKCPQVLERYTEDPEFALQLRKLLALAFVPVVNVVTAFEELMATKFYEDNESVLQPVTDYFEDVWIGRMQRTRRRAPLFSHELWNCFDSTVVGGPRTNNKVEGWNRRFKSLLGATHPSIWTFLDKIKEEQGVTELKLGQLAAGQQIEKRKRKYRDLESRILKAVERYGTGNVSDFLTKVAHNVVFNT